MNRIVIAVVITSGVGLWILLASTVTNYPKRQLKVSIYPYIPDLVGDELETLMNWIEASFESLYTEIDLSISKPSEDIYNTEQIRQLFESTNAPHILEIDVVMLESLVNNSLLVRIKPEDYDLDVEGAYLKFSLQAVQHNGIYYGVPTLICGHYLMGINGGDNAATCPLQNGVNDYSSLRTVLSNCEHDLLMPPRTMTVLGNFKGSFTLPHIYIDAYIDQYGSNSVYEAINSNINAEADVINTLISFFEYCQETSQLPSTNTKCLSGTINDSIFTEDIVQSKAITAYSYSEYIGSHLQYGIKEGMDVNVYSIIAPPLGPQNNFLMDTDALVINKAMHSSATEQDISAFIRFYSSLSTRLSIAFGEDMPEPHSPRYLMQAIQGFYDVLQVTSDAIYAQLTETLQYAVAGPNRLLYNARHRMSKQLFNILSASNHVKTVSESSSVQQCKQRSFQYSHQQNRDFEN